MSVENVWHCFFSQPPSSLTISHVKNCVPQSTMIFLPTYLPASSTLTQCSLSVLELASHFFVTNEYAFPMISASKKVVNSGYSSVNPLMCRYPHNDESFKLTS